MKLYMGGVLITAIIIADYLLTYMKIGLDYTRELGPIVSYLMQIGPLAWIMFTAVYIIFVLAVYRAENPLRIPFFAFYFGTHVNAISFSLGAEISMVIACGGILVMCLVPAVRDFLDIEIG